MTRCCLPRPPSVAAGWSAAQSAALGSGTWPIPPVRVAVTRRGGSAPHAGSGPGGRPCPWSLSERQAGLGAFAERYRRRWRRKSGPAPKWRRRRSATPTHVFVPAEAWSRRGCRLPGTAHSVRRVAPRFGDSTSPVGAWPRQRLIMWTSDGEWQSAEANRARLGSAWSGGPPTLP